MNDPRITAEDSDFYQKPTDYAMSIFSFYMCYVCKVFLPIELIAYLLFGRILISEEGGSVNKLLRERMPLNIIQQNYYVEDAAR